MLKEGQDNRGLIERKGVKNMYATRIFVMVMLFSLTLYHGEAKAAITDCQPGCFIALTDTDGVLFVDEGGSILHTLTGVGAGSGNVFGSSAYAVIVRQSTREVWVYDLRKGSLTCYLPNLGWESNKAVVLDGNAWITHEQANIASKVELSTCDVTDVPLDRSGYVGIEKTANAIWLLNSSDGNILRIDPLTNGYTSYVSGLSSSNAPLFTIKYNGTGFFIAGRIGVLNGAVFETLVPPNSYTLWQQVPYYLSDMELDGNYVVSEAYQENHFYIMPRSNPATYQTRILMDIRSVAIRGGVILAAGGAAPDIGLWRYNEINGFARDATPVAISDTWSVTSSGYIPVCGDGLTEEAETCDSSDVGAETCQSQGFDGGVLGCDTTCDEYDTSWCYSCGDGNIEAGEQCDGTNLGGETCESRGFDGGMLVCNLSCDGFDTSGCYSCGDGIVAADEQCDGVDLGGETCQSQGFDDGELVCNLSCDGFDTSGCYSCGDGIVAAGEQCDGADLGGETCESSGFDGGELACDSSCRFDFDQCWRFCGNGQVDPGEECDGDDVDGQTCENLGYIGGILSCQPNCTFGTYECEEPPLCGNGRIDPGEKCDGDDVAGKVCSGWGYNAGGVVRCSTDCSEYDLSRCVYIPPEDASGCGCNSGRMPDGAIWLPIFILLAVLLRRKRLQ